jgi:hypothetical protein
MGAAIRQCDQAIDGLRLEERLREVAGKTIPAAMKYACAVLLSAAEGRADGVASALEKANGDGELRRFVLWLPFILDNLWDPYPPEGGPTLFHEVPDGTTGKEKEQAGEAFGWRSLGLPADPPAQSLPTNAQQDAPAARLRSALAELRRLHDDLVRLSNQMRSRLPDADLDRLWALDTQVELLATQLGIARPDAGSPAAHIRERGWTRIRYHSTNFGTRLDGGPVWEAGMNRLTALAEALEAEPAALRPITSPGRPVEETGNRSPQPAVEGQTPTRREDTAGKIDLEAQALALLLRHKDWSLAQIADHIGVDRKTLYKWKDFREAAQLAGRLKPRGPKDRAPRRGHKTRDGRVEAYSEEDDE